MENGTDFGLFIWQKISDIIFSQLWMQMLDYCFKKNNTAISSNEKYYVGVLMETAGWDGG